jgi:phosphoribosyl 1,2-cyclic phosphodiesterase
MNGSGHLCNTEAAEFLANNFHSRLRNVWLCHLSHHNNLPELARQAVRSALEQRGIPSAENPKIVALERNSPSEMYLLNE